MSDSPSDRSPPGDDFDPDVEETFESPYEVYADLRSRCPVAHSTAYGGFWALTRYKDVVDAVTDTDTFITSKINVIPNMSLGERRPPLGKDPPEHTPYRRALDRTLRAGRVKQLEVPLRAHAIREIDRMIDAGEADISSDLGTILPAWVAVEWLNLEPEKAQFLAKVARLYNIAWRASDKDAVKNTSLQLYAIAENLVDDRIRNPRDVSTDPASALLKEETPDGPIPRDYVVATLRQALVVGLMAPPPLFGSIAVHLSRDQELQDFLRSDPSQIPAAVEEFLRMYTPYRGFARTTTRPVTLHGRTILPDEPVTIVYSSANRDEEVFPQADQFILNRPNIRDHLAFGKGAHSCAGMGLVRLEIRMVLEELLSRTKRFTLAGPIETTRLPELGPIVTPLAFEDAR
ncbi:cytochrome P450 [Altererythrobacter indicus]|uniref:Cytochrome P450 n=1 Tax=Altericroceibacterium indicum TaxID=374177 RepID=A0A845AHW8_9SPHN|nr:cytochrome P450 [Altericroceibacterium indicum]MXP26708.1 cytochrome P450 [Altericroceibacterium indicum]